MTMQLNDNALDLTDANNEKCDACGLGFKPDERMNFAGVTVTSLIESAVDCQAAIQDKMYTLDCLLAKIMEIQKGETVASC